MFRNSHAGWSLCSGCQEAACGELVEAKHHFQNKPFCTSVSFNATHAEDKDHRPGYHFQWPESADELYEDVKFPEPELGDEKYFKAMPPFRQKEEGLSRKRYYWRWARRPTIRPRSLNRLQFRPTHYCGTQKPVRAIRWFTARTSSPRHGRQKVFQWLETARPSPTRYLPRSNRVFTRFGKTTDI